MSDRACCHDLTTRCVEAVPAALLGVAYEGDLPAYLERAWFALLAVCEEEHRGRRAAEARVAALEAAVDG